MEEKRAEPEKLFEHLPKEERKQLRREFGRIVEVRFKICLWIGIGLLLPVLVSGGFSIYYMVKIIFDRVVVFQLYICAVIFTTGCCLSLLLTTQYHKRFNKWLKEYKNIISRNENAKK